MLLVLWVPDNTPVTYSVEEETSQRGKKKLLTSDGFSFTVRVNIISS